MAQTFNYPMGSGGKPPAKKPAPAPVAAEPEQEMGEAEDGAQIAEEHGPAHEVHIQHDHEAGQHHVTSEHPDGHHHESDHEDAKHAHEHAAKLAGVAGHEEPDGDEGEY